MPLTLPPTTPGFANTLTIAHRAGPSLYMWPFAKRTNLIAGGKALYGELLASGANVQGEPVSRPWGLREFRVIDPEGNQLTFWQPFE